jgi:non-heme chloroperoxidase
MVLLGGITGKTKTPSSFIRPFMKFVHVKDAATGGEFKLHYADLGSGKPVVFLHGWPLSKEMWEYNIVPLVEQGLRCIAYDRRGFGRSEKPWNGYDYDTLADDLKAFLDALDLQDVTLVGFSMGGGEVARYFSRHGGARVTKAVLIASVTPYMLKTDDNPDGTPQEQFDTMLEQMKADRPGFLESFGKTFYGVGLISHPVSTPFLQHDLALAMRSSPRAMTECAKSFSSTDFRPDMPQINVPTLIIHGDADKTVPIEAAGDESAKLVPDNTYLVYEGAPHGLFYTERERLNSDLANFILDVQA